MILKHGSGLKTVLSFIFIFCTGIMFGQCQNGKVLSSDNESGIGYVSIGIIGKNVGTVSDQNGNFRLNIDGIYDNDSLRFSMIGFEAKCLAVKEFKKNPLKNIYLRPRITALDEVKVSYYKPKKIRLGTPVSENNLRSGFDSNDLGSEMGIEFSVKRRVKLKDINLNVATCTFDTVTYRLNIYQSDDATRYKNILTEPIYISFAGDDANEMLTFDLSAYSIIVEGNVLIAMELFKDLGEGKLLFNTRYFEGSTLHRKTSEGNWTKAPGAIGMYLTSFEIR